MPALHLRLAAPALAFALVLAATLSPARAETLRCYGATVSEGDSRLSVQYKCGPPLLADAYCAPVYLPGSLYPVPPQIAGAYVPCVLLEEWLYERGPGNLVAVVTFRYGKVQSIRYGRWPD